MRRAPTGMTSPFRRPATIGAIAAAVLVLAGVALWVTAPSTDASFGWFAYAPLADVASMGAFILHGQVLAAAALVVVGLIIGGVALGFRWGRSAGGVGTRPRTDPCSHPSRQ